MSEKNDNKINVLVADDSSVVRGSIRQMLEKTDDIEMVGAAIDGEQCLNQLEKLAVDIVILDVDMPVMDGLSTLREMIKRHPKIKVIMFSTITEKGSKETFQALSMGANDFITKPSARKEGGGLNIKEVEGLLLQKIRSLVPKARNNVSRLDTKGVILREDLMTTKPAALLVGSSTGGPDALSLFFNQLSVVMGELPPIFLAQHMPPIFTEHLARRIEFDTGIPSKEGEDGELVKRGTLYIAPGDYHMLVKRKNEEIVISLNQDDRINYCRPAVDPLFESVADIYGPKILAVILTGMGTDGREGCRRIVDVGGLVIAQDKESSVVWGMPGAVAQAGLASALEPVIGLADYVIRKVQ